MAGKITKFKPTANFGYFLQWKFSYIYDQIEPNAIREIAKFDDENIKLLLSGLICEIAGNLKYIPKQRYKTKIAKSLIERGIDKNRVLKISNVSERTYYNLKAQSG